MNTYDQVKYLTDTLCKRQPFRKPSITSIQSGTDYRLYRSVPAHCLTVSSGADDSVPKLPKVIIDLLICRGREAIYAIVFDADKNAQQVFDTYLESLPHSFLDSDTMNDDLMLDTCGEIQFDMLCDADAPVHTGCFLYAVSIQVAVSRMQLPALLEKVSSHLRPFLQEKHLVDSSGAVTPYGHSCGLFQRCLASRPYVYLVAHHSTGALHQAIHWFDCAADAQSLECRLSRIRQGLPADASQCNVQMLRDLLRTPLEDYFARYPEDFSHLRTLLARAQYLSFGSEVSAFGDRESIDTYGDVIYAVRNLWEYTARRDRGNAEAAEVCELLLTLLSFPLWSMPEIPAAEAFASSADGSLQERLNSVRPEIYHTPLALMPVQHYFYAAAAMTESEYPLWLYRIAVNPMLEFYHTEGPLCIQALSTVYQLSQSENESEKADYFPLLYDFLVEPFSGIV